MSGEWPFDDPRNAATITTRRIIHQGRPILLVTHHAEDGAWTFMDGETFEEEQALVIGLANMIARDPSLADLADLPLGWQAWRAGPREPWQRRRVVPGE